MFCFTLIMFKISNNENVNIRVISTWWITVPLYFIINSIIINQNARWTKLFTEIIYLITRNASQVYTQDLNEL